jgi:hypothetical protein
MNRYPTGTCKLGETYCPTTGTCIGLGGTCPVPPPSPYVPGFCPAGTQYNPATRRCEGAAPAPGPYVPGICPPMQTYCESTRSCVPLIGGQCPPSPSPAPFVPGFCPAGTQYNPVTRRCEGAAPSPSPFVPGFCPAGTQYNPVTRKCEGASPAPGPYVPGICPPMHKYCETTRSCVPLIGGECPASPPPFTPGICPPGHQYDPATRSCQVVKGLCPLGQKWCETTGECVPLIGGYCPPHHAMGLCPKGQTYCPESKQCVNSSAVSEFGCPGVSSDAHLVPLVIRAKGSKSAVFNPLSPPGNPCDFSTAFLCTPAERLEWAGVPSVFPGGPEVASWLNNQPGQYQGCTASAVGRVAVAPHDARLVLHDSSPAVVSYSQSPRMGGYSLRL